MLLLALAVASTLGTRPPTGGMPCVDARTTIAVDQCLARHRDEALRTLDRYRVTARARLVRENPENGALPLAFDAAQAAWVNYARQQCGAVYRLWQGGTIRGAMSTSCEIRMAQLRTHELWRDWLTYADSTPPVLPEPVVETGA